MDWAFISALGGLGGALMGAAALFTTIRSERNRRADARKADAEAAETVSDAALKLITPQKTRIDELETEIRSLRTVMAQMAEKHADELADLRKQINDRDSVIMSLQSWRQRHEEGIKRLAAQVVSLGGQPVYTLPSDEAGA
jgi:small-conductance mechanosensitive channel